MAVKEAVYSHFLFCWPIHYLFPAFRPAGAGHARRKKANPF